MATRCSECDTELPEGYQEPCPECGSTRRTVSLQAESIGVSSAVAAATVWLSQTSAPQWLNDARTEAEQGEKLQSDLDEEHSKTTQQELVRSLHREIVFAVCFAEAFLLEYLRDYIFIHRPGKGHREALVQFVEREKDARGIPRWERSGIRKRWKWAVKTLQEEGKLEDQPAFEGQAWQAFQEELAPFRNGIVHASISRPTRASEEDAAEPSPGDLLDLGPGWATSIVTELAHNLHGLNPREVDPPQYLALE